ncbi:MAG: GAF domain-containing sensor histidine kinase [Nocardiopsaceae bacterium]|nr:GAF domain-containing sensor histidine kinase [Nocardiopsaceae bacterium]
MVLGRPADPDPGPAGYRRGVETYLAELNRVSQAVLAVSRQLRTRDALRVIVRSARTLADAKYAALGVPDDRGSFGEFVVAGISAAQQRAIGPLPRQHGMLAALLKASEPVRLADIREDPRFEGWPDAHPEMSGFLGVPVRNGPEIMGIIFVANKTSGEPFTEHDTELLSLFAGHAAIALTNARLHERARELSVLQERGRLARELHDAVSQRLFSIRAHARAASALVARDCQRAAGEIAAVAELGAQAHAELRAVIDGLAPPELDGLAASLRRYAALASRAHGVPVEVRAPDTGELPADVSAAAFRVAQEALHNALRHSGASSVRVSLSRSPRRLTLTVADDGTGFDPSLAPGELGLAPGGLGLASMRERASSAGGVLRVHSAPGDGTEVRLTVPVRGGSS